MLFQKLYYTIKPYLPWRLRIELRRIVARWKRSHSRDVWPISPTAATPPPNWPGWPDGKKFAFVLTHDVEDQAGYDQCLALMKLDRSLGFKSAFNLIPEGPYRVSAELRHELQQAGFEVGVHDLRHDGWLFVSRSGFKLKAPRINHYLREWGAAGFRSGFMLRNLSWLHHLDIHYDSSTFDTDPFELQSTGANTIFPFWVSTPRAEARSASPYGRDVASTRGGYVELPYTLTQDSTMFLVLREESPEIWMRKLDWIVANGGLALLDVHPDYIRFDGEPPSPRTYPVAYYREFLKYVAQRYAGQYWQPLPRELADFTANIRPPQRYDS